MGWRSGWRGEGAEFSWSLSGAVEEKVRDKTAFLNAYSERLPGLSSPRTFILSLPHRDHAMHFTISSDSHGHSAVDQQLPDTHRDFLDVSTE